ncbi:hypothetical protein M422DRAFT_25518 [Sphaerobolus stellatus SS14]|nr:hypothetical protein M422DRAFT_25518 [Sphaerobolus stellatus SS14]
MTSANRWPPLTILSPWKRIALVSTSLAGSEDDIEVAAMRSDPRTRLYLPFMPLRITPDEWRVIREDRAKKDDTCDFHARFVMPSSSNQDPLSESGSLSLLAAQATIMEINLVNRSGELGLIVKPELHRSGIATELLYLLLRHAFEHPGLKLHRACFVTGKDNVQMKGWLEAFGIEQEFRFREAWSDGKGGYVDAVGYSILDREWPELKERLEVYLDKRLGNRQ